VANENIFRPSTSDPWRKNAVIGAHFAEAANYEITFSEAAKQLGDTAIETGLLDFYFYPMCFLFRHAFELTLKSLTLDAERFLVTLNELGETNVAVNLAGLEERLRTHRRAHSLEWLLQHLEDRLRQIPSCEAIPRNVRSAVLELHGIDPDGATFRYSIDRQGKRTLPTHALVDVQRVRDELGEVHELLFYGLGTWLYEGNHDAMQFLSEMQAEAGY